MAMMAYVGLRIILFPSPYSPTPAGVFVILAVLSLLSLLFAAGIGIMFSARRRAASPADAADRREPKPVIGLAGVRRLGRFSFPVDPSMLRQLTESFAALGETAV